MDSVRLADESRRRTKTAVPAAVAAPRIEPPPQVGGPNNRRTNMADINTTLQRIKQIQGAMGAAVVDYETGMCLGSMGDGRLNLDLAAAGNAEVVRAKLRVMNDLKIQGGIHDILITLEDQLHIIRPIPKSNLFIYLAIDKKQGNLGIARHKLQEIETALSL
jgi:hypothetical protein